MTTISENLRHGIQNFESRWNNFNTEWKDSVFIVITCTLKEGLNSYKICQQTNTKTQESACSLITGICTKVLLQKVCGIIFALLQDVLLLLHYGTVICAIFAGRNKLVSSKNQMAWTSYLNIFTRNAVAQYPEQELRPKHQHKNMSTEQYFRYDRNTTVDTNHISLQLTVVICFNSSCCWLHSICSKPVISCQVLQIIVLLTSMQDK